MATSRRVRPADVAHLASGPIEYSWVEGSAGGVDRAPIVLLHEGLGCVALWREFPFLVARATGRRVLVYSRYGYGGSGPAILPRPVEFMHHEAVTVLPELLARLALPPAVLVGHSDGASIALLAAGHHTVDTVGVAVLAPHVFVEDISIDGIEHARRRFLADGTFRSRLARYHRDPDMAFWGWNDVWLSEGFRSWDITDVVGPIDVPVVAVQGRDDPYGTLAQLDAIEARLCVPYTPVVMDSTGHAPHLEHPAETVEALAAVLAGWP